MMRSMGLDDRMTGEIVRRVLSVTTPAKIILFGSAARGDMTADSDIDLLIVSENPPRDLQSRTKVYQSLRGLGRPVDVCFISTQWFEASKDVFGGIAYPAHKEGRVIYDAA